MDREAWCAAVHSIGQDWAAEGNWTSVQCICLWCILINLLCEHSESTCMHACSVASVVSTLCDPVDCRLPGSSVHGILQERILKWIAVSFSRGSSQPRDQTTISCLAGGFSYHWAVREVLWTHMKTITMANTFVLTILYQTQDSVWTWKKKF